MCKLHREVALIGIVSGTLFMKGLGLIMRRMPHNSTGSGKKTTLFLSLRLPLVSGHFVSILRAKNTVRKRTSRDHGCSPVLLPCRSGRMSEIDADQCHFVMPFTGDAGAVARGSGSSSRGAMTVAAAVSETPRRCARAVRERAGASPRRRAPRGGRAGGHESTDWLCSAPC
jgi:hypothetical protein